VDTVEFETVDPGTVASELARILQSRDLDALRRTLSLALHVLEAAPRQCSPEFLDYVVRCLDLDWSLIPIVERVFPLVQTNGDLTLSARAHVDIAEGLLHFHRSRYDQARLSFDTAALVAARIPNADLHSIALYYQARVLWRKAEYRAAFELAERAKELAAQCNLRLRVALIALLQGWLQFLLGNFDSADALVEQTERAVAGTNDHLTNGDVQSYKGRRARQSGDLDDAIRFFKNAIVEYERFDVNYRNIARCHQNIAYVMHLRVRRTVEAETAANRHQTRVQSEKDRREGIDHSKEAERLYTMFPERTRRRLAKVLNDRALLLYDASLWDDAYLLAQKSVQLAAGGDTGGAGQDDADKVTLADAKIIACMAALELDSLPAAVRFAREAVDLVRPTENRRVRARAAIWLGNALLRLDNPLEAQELWRTAVSELGPERRQRSSYDYLLKDLAQLGDAIDKWEKRTGDPTVVHLKSSDILGFTLQAVQDRVASAVIRHIYELNKQNISATAKDLGVGHMRVRGAAGLTRRVDGRGDL
jgi:tetratricopeptide (TPR) repeat protein